MNNQTKEQLIHLITEAHARGFVEAADFIREAIAKETHQTGNVKLTVPTATEGYRWLTEKGYFSSSQRLLSGRTFGSFDVPAFIGETYCRIFCHVIQ